MTTSETPDLHVSNVVLMRLKFDQRFFVAVAFEGPMTRDRGGRGQGGHALTIFCRRVPRPKGYQSC